MRRAGSIKVGKANKNDLDIYAEILKSSLGLTHAEALRLLKRKKLENILKIEVDGVPVGFTNFTHRGNVFYINDLDVLKSRRKKGYGSLLLSHLEREVGRRKVKRIWLHVNIKNRPAIRFYLSNGYQIVKILKRFYAKKFDAYVLSKEL